jgi:non-ribosomal peptide synthetase component F
VNEHDVPPIDAVTAGDSGRCIHASFEAQVDLTPDNIAVSWGHDAFTYRELNQRANRLAHFLRSRGVGPNVFVGICVERTPMLIVGLLGILKATCRSIRNIRASALPSSCRMRARPSS